MGNDYKNVQSAIDTLLNIKSVIRRKKKTEQNRKKHKTLMKSNQIFQRKKREIHFFLPSNQIN